MDAMERNNKATWGEASATLNEDSATPLVEPVGEDDIPAPVPLEEQLSWGPRLNGDISGCFRSFGAEASNSSKNKMSKQNNAVSIYTGNYKSV